MNLKIYSERSQFTIKSTALLLTGRFCQNSCHDSLRWGQSVVTMSSFLQVLTPRGFSIHWKSFSKLLMSFLWRNWALSNSIRKSGKNLSYLHLPLSISCFRVSPWNFNFYILIMVIRSLDALKKSKRE